MKLFPVLFLFVCLFPLSSHKSRADEEGLKTAHQKEITDQSLKNNERILSQAGEKEEESPSSASTEETKEADEEGAVTKKIKKVFEDFIKILEKETLQSSEYSKAVRFLEHSLYSEAGFDTLKVLSKVYEEKKDFTNQINVLNILSANYPKNEEAFYLLGMAYRNLYRTEEDNKSENRKKSIENINQALKVNPKYVLAYTALMDLLMIKDPKTGEEIHTRDSLFLVIEMAKNLRKKENYIPLCKAYYDNNFLKQSRKICKKSVQKNPNDPVSSLMLAFTRPKKDIGKHLSLTAEKFKDSFFVQYKTALYFMNRDSKVAIKYFNVAYQLEPEHLLLNKIMSQFLLDSKEEEASYKHFLKTCQLTEGRFLEQFKKAVGVLRKRGYMDLVPKFKKGINQCFLDNRKKHRSKNK